MNILQLAEQLRTASPETIVRAMQKLKPAERARVQAQLEALSFSTFVRAAWPVIDSRPLVWNWHLEAMCLHLEALARHEISHLAINVPPGSGKSMICTVLWPCWRWASWPSWQVICASYSSSLAEEHSIKRRQLIESAWYKERHARPDHPHGWSLSTEQNSKDEFQNTARGHMSAIGIGGAGTGKRCDSIILDDPQNAQEAHSKAAMEQAIRFQDLVASTRYNDMTQTEMLLVQQRLSDRDSTAHSVAQKGWTHLRLPAEYEADEPCVTYRKDGSKLWEDPRRVDGELLFPARLPKSVLDGLKDKMAGDYYGQYQQRPTPMGGGMFAVENWRFWKSDREQRDHVASRPRGCYDGPANFIDLDEVEEQLISVDATFRKTKSGSYVAIHVWGKKGARRLLLDRVHARMDFADTVAQLLAVIERWPRARRKLIEGKANGDAIISALTTEYGITGVESVNPGTQSKEDRAAAAQPYQKAGNVELPDGAPWLGEYIGEHSAFPLGRHDDDVDAQAQGLLGFERRRGGAWLYDEIEL